MPCATHDAIPRPGPPGPPGLTSMTPCCSLFGAVAGTMLSAMLMLRPLGWA